MARKMKYIAIALVTITIIFVILYRLLSIGVLLSALNYIWGNLISFLLSDYWSVIYLI